MDDIRLRLAAALLLQYGEISMSEIEALPLVESKDVAEALADELIGSLGAEIYQRRDGLTWEYCLRLSSSLQSLPSKTRRSGWAPLVMGRS